MDFVISYSVVIRTLGKTGEPYKKLLASIYSQTVLPEAVIVVIPKGYTLDYTTGKETIIYSEKGMCTQRAVGISAVKSKYMLVVDDDVFFGSTMVCDLYRYLTKFNLHAALPMEGVDDGTPVIDLRRSLYVRLRGTFTGQYFESNKMSSYLNSLTLTAGTKVYINSNQKDKMYLCDTACFQCFFINTHIAKSARLEDELWLEQGTLNQYAAYDEPVFFYKLKTLGDFKMSYDLQTYYTHLDARIAHESTEQTNKLLSERINRLYSISRNRTIYWYKFLWSNNKKTITLIAGIYGFLNYTIYNLIINCCPKYWKAIGSMFLGYKDAVHIIKKLRIKSK